MASDTTTTEPTVQPARQAASRGGSGGKPPTRTAVATGGGRDGWRILSDEAADGFVAWGEDRHGTKGYMHHADREIDARLAVLHAITADGGEVVETGRSRGAA